MIIYNANHLDSNKRFLVCILIGTLFSVMLGIVYGTVLRLVRIEMEILFILVGYLIGQILRYFGHGVTQKYAILGAILACISIIVGDLVRIGGIYALFWVVRSPALFVQTLSALLKMQFSSMWGLVGLMFRGVAVYTAYCESRIL